MVNKRFSIGRLLVSDPDRLMSIGHEMNQFNALLLTLTFESPQKNTVINSVKRCRHIKNGKHRLIVRAGIKRTNEIRIHLQ